mmetsp:Transcript_18601/g.62639  ORF Transcript_18601/g.62639 Transcript_18601/m.62639 type:complete len:237 (-) Transcript_18601:561-1271(-)
MRPRLSPAPPSPSPGPCAPSPGPRPSRPALCAPELRAALSRSLEVGRGEAFLVASPAASPPVSAAARSARGSVRGPPRRRTRLAGGCCAGSSGRRLGRGKPSLASRHRPARLVEGAHLVEESLGEEGRRHLLSGGELEVEKCCGGELGRLDGSSRVGEGGAAWDGELERDAWLSQRLLDPRQQPADGRRDGEGRLQHRPVRQPNADRRLAVPPPPPRRLRLARRPRLQHALPLPAR